MEFIMNKKAVFAVLTAVLVLAAIIAGIVINNNSGNETKTINIYFLNENSSSIVPETRKIKYNSGDDVLGLVLDNILKGPSNNKRQPVVGKNTRVLNTSFEENNLTVDFSKEFLRDDTTENMLSVYAIIRTLCQVDKVTGVMVTVEGEPVTAADGTIIGFLTNTDIDLESDMNAADLKEITLYFADKNSEKLVKEVRTIKITDTRPIESYVINELIKGPADKELTATLSADTELISAETAKGTCHVTFKNFIDKNLFDPSSEKSKLAVYSVVNSLAELDDVRTVRFLFEGKTEEYVGQFDFSREFKADRDLVK